LVSKVRQSTAVNQAGSWSG